MLHDAVFFKRAEVLEIFLDESGNVVSKPDGARLRLFADDARIAAFERLGKHNGLTTILRRVKQRTEIFLAETIDKINRTITGHFTSGHCA